MENLKVYSLYSGSKGNSTYIEYGDDAILLDAGGSYLSLSRTVTEIGGDTHKIKSVFITHEHRDHVSALETLTKRLNVPIHMTAPSAKKLEKSASEALSLNIIEHPPIYEETVSAIHIKSFRTYHDAAMCVGYKVTFDGCAAALGLLTDTGHITDEIVGELSGCTHLIMEANHDVDMLMHGSYPYFLKERILSPRGHLSNEQSAELAADLASCGAERIVLAHLSEQNNTRTLAMSEVSGAIAGYGVSLDAASQSSPVRVI
ncbi:MAG: MBL fold metallo-hydrolase [Firmicutes bacterium]|nr:MBL fold metallo-hydrolase [Bacillota bacterium]